MITILFFIVFGKLFIFALKVGWSVFKIVVYLVFLPGIILAMIFGGLLYVAIPIIIVAGIAGLATRAY
jgi:hypothetical protein